MRILRNDFSKVGSNLLLLFKVTRPISWLAGLLLFLLGFFVSGAQTSLLFYLNILIFPSFAIIIFGINDVYDYKTDILSKRKSSIIDGYTLNPAKHNFVKQAALVSAIVLIVHSIITFNISHMVATLLGIMLAYAYSMPPVRLKEKPVIDSLSNGLAVLIMLMIGYSYGASILEFPFKLALASIGAAAGHALGAIIDYTPDKRSGVKTIATELGKRGAAIFSAVIILLIINVSGIKSVILNGYMILALIVCLILIIKTSEKFARFMFGICMYGFMVAVAVFMYQQFFI